MHVFDTFFPDFCFVLLFVLSVFARVWRCHLYFPFMLTSNVFGTFFLLKYPALEWATFETGLICAIRKITTLFDRCKCAKILLCKNPSN